MKRKGDNTGRFISLLLSHKPEIIGITLDEHGWARVDELIARVNRTRSLDMAGLEEIVRTDEKQRYCFNADKTKIRANQGQSVPVDVELEVVTPPEILHHGTGEKYVASVETLGLIPKTRLYVHLFGDHETAYKVRARCGRLWIHQVHSVRMAADSYTFYRSVNGVWLTKIVPLSYLTRT